MYKVFGKIRSKASLIRNLYRCFFYRQLELRHAKFEHFINHTLRLGAREYSDFSDIIQSPPRYDNYICGSDQIWNMNCPDFDESYFLQFTDSTNRIAYAPSFGTPFFTEKIEEELKRLLAGIHYLSTRETEGQRLIHKLTGRTAKVVLDPTMLLSADDWSNIAIHPKVKHPYILCYFLNNNNGDRRYIDLLRSLSGYKVIILNDYIRDLIKGYSIRLDAGPLDFLGLVMNASFIYTNSFHGTAFATIFHKPFITAVGKRANLSVNNTDSRKIDLLHMIGQTSRLVSDEDQHSVADIQALLKIDWHDTDEILWRQRDDSFAYLRESMQMNEVICA